MKPDQSNFTRTSVITGICILLIISNEVSDPRITTIDSLKQAGYEILDLHAHLKGALLWTNYFPILKKQALITE